MDCKTEYMRNQKDDMQVYKIKYKIAKKKSNIKYHNIYYTCQSNKCLNHMLIRTQKQYIIYIMYRILTEKA